MVAAAAGVLTVIGSAIALWPTVQSQDAEAEAAATAGRVAGLLGCAAIRDAPFASCFVRTQTQLAVVS